MLKMSVQTTHFLSSITNIILISPIKKTLIKVKNCGKIIFQALKSYGNLSAKSLPRLKTYEASL